MAGGVAGGIAGGALAKKAQDAILERTLGAEGVAQLEAKREADRMAHPIATEIGAMFGTLPAMAGGGGGSKLLKMSGMGEKAADLIAAAAGGAALQGSQAAQDQRSIRDVAAEALKGAAVFGVTGFIKPARSILQAVGIKAPKVAAIYAAADMLYDWKVRGIPPPQSSEELGKRLKMTGESVPGFMLMELIDAAFKGMPVAAPKRPTTAQPPPLPQKRPIRGLLGPKVTQMPDETYTAFAERMGRKTPGKGIRYSSDMQGWVVNREPTTEEIAAMARADEESAATQAGREDSEAAQMEEDMRKIRESQKSATDEFGHAEESELDVRQRNFAALMRERSAEEPRKQKPQIEQSFSDPYDKGLLNYLSGYLPPEVVVRLTGEERLMLGNDSDQLREAAELYDQIDKEERDAQETANATQPVDVNVQPDARTLAGTTPPQDEAQVRGSEGASDRRGDSDVSGPQPAGQGEEAAVPGEVAPQTRLYEVMFDMPHHKGNIASVEAASHAEAEAKVRVSVEPRGYKVRKGQVRLSPNQEPTTATSGAPIPPAPTEKPAGTSAPVVPAPFTGKVGRRMTPKQIQSADAKTLADAAKNNTFSDGTRVYDHVTDRTKKGYRRALLDHRSIYMAAERARLEAQQQKRDMEARQAAPIVGRGVDTTGDMFDQSKADNPLFAAPTTKPNTARKLMWIRDTAGQVSDTPGTTDGRFKIYGDSAKGFSLWDGKNKGGRWRTDTEAKAAAQRILDRKDDAKPPELMTPDGALAWQQGLQVANSRASKGKIVLRPEFTRESRRPGVALSGDWERDLIAARNAWDYYIKSDAFDPQAEAPKAWRNEVIIDKALANWIGMPERGTASVREGDRYVFRGEKSKPAETAPVIDATLPPEPEEPPQRGLRQEVPAEGVDVAPPVRHPLAEQHADLRDGLVEKALKQYPNADHDEIQSVAELALNAAAAAHDTAKGDFKPFAKARIEKAIAKEIKRQNAPKSMGPGAAAAAEFELPDKDVMEEADRAMRDLSPEKPGADSVPVDPEQRDNLMQRIGKGHSALTQWWLRVKAAANGFAKVLNGAPVDKTDFDTAMSEHYADIRQANGLAAQYSKRLNSYFPDPLRKAGMGKYMEAMMVNEEDPMGQLQDWASRSTGNNRRPYQIAQNLTAREKTACDNLVSLFRDLGLKAQKEKLLGEMIDDYAGQHMVDLRGLKPGQIPQPLLDLRAAATTGRLSTSFGPAAKRSFETEFDLEQAGHKLKTSNPFDKVVNYSHSLETVLANRAAVRKLMSATTHDGYDLLDADGKPAKDARGKTLRAGTIEEANRLAAENPGTTVRERFVNVIATGVGVRTQEAEKFAVIREGKTRAVRVFDTKEEADDYAAGLKDTTVEKRAWDNTFVNPHIRPFDGVNYVLVHDIPAFQRWKWMETDPETGRNIYVKGDLYVHANHVQDIKNTFGRSTLQNGVLGMIARAGGMLKALKLSASAFHQGHLGAYAVFHLTRPFGMPEVNWKDPFTYKALKASLGLADGQYRELVSEGASSNDLMHRIPGFGKIMAWYQEYLFGAGGYIDRLKLATFRNVLRRNLSRYSGKMSEDAIWHQSATEVNHVFGKLPWDRLAVDPTFHHGLSMTLLAPDFQMAHLGVAWNAIKGSKEHRMALGIMVGGIYTTARVLNMLLNEDNDPHYERPFSIVVGNREYSFRSIASDVQHLVKDPHSFMYARLSPQASMAVEALTKRNWLGERETASEMAKQMAYRALPVPLTPRPDVSMGQRAVTWFGGTVRRYSPTSDLHKLAAEYRAKNDPTYVAEADYPTSKYRDLRYALEDGNIDRASTAINDLISKGQKAGEVRDGFLASIYKPLTRDHKMDAKFRAQLDDSGKKLLAESQAMKKEMQSRFMDALRAARAGGAATTPEAPAEDAHGGTSPAGKRLSWDEFVKGVTGG